MRRVKAFTLVELLVVIGIIALLISILLPAMAAARRQAMKTKCAAQMHDIGNAMLMYGQDNNGYLPPARLNTLYTLDNLTYGKNLTSETYGVSVNENAKWWHFIAKYVTKKKPMPQKGDPMSEFMATTFWCPAFPGDVDGVTSNLIDGINRNITGIAYNQYPSFSGTNPASGTDFPPTSEQFADCLAKTNAGKWYKLTQFTHPSERAILGDGTQYYLEAKAVASSAAIPGQRLLFSTDDFSTGVNGQTTFDFYRHGVYPSIAVPDTKDGYFSASGGKIGYNILYTDIHVESPSDRETAYRAGRLRFPN